MGILSITPRDENENPIATEDLVNFVIVFVARAIVHRRRKKKAVKSES